MKIKKLRMLLTTLILSFAMALVVPSFLPLRESVTVVEAAVKLNKTSATTLVGETVQLKMKGISSKKKVTWKSSNKKVATVSATGLVSTLKSGTITISAKVNKKTYKCKIKVKNNQFTQSAPTLKKLESGLIHFHPMKVYYKNGKLHYVARIYNRKPFRISSISKVKLAVTIPDGSDEGLMIAEKYIENSIDLTQLNKDSTGLPAKLNPGKFVTYDFVFSGSELVETDFDLTEIKKIYYTAQYVFEY